MWSAIAVCLSLLVTSAQSYVPATTSNATEGVVGSQNAIMNLFFNRGEGRYSSQLLRQAFVPGSEGISMGALVHYTDPPPSAASTKTPWAAFISCDANSTDASTDDILSLAKKSGAVAALLYSEHSVTCVVDAQYAKNPALDVYVPQSLSNSWLIADQFRNIDAARYGSFDAVTLDSEADNVNSFVSSGTSVDPGYLIINLVVTQPIFSSTITSLPSSTSAATSPADATGSTTPATGAGGTNGSGSLHNVYSQTLLFLGLAVGTVFVKGI